MKRERDASRASSGPHKVAIVLREDLEPWKRLNVAAFTVSGVAAFPGAVGEPYRDASALAYLPMLQEPVLVFGGTGDELGRTADRARSRVVPCSVFTEQLFGTFNDADNRAAVAAVPTPSLAIVGLAFRADHKTRSSRASSCYADHRL